MGKHRYRKTVNFTPVQTSKIKLVVSEGQNGFGSAAEFRVLTGTQDLTKTQLRMSTYVEGEGTATVSKEKIEQGEEVTFTATAKKGATFTGWYDVLGTKVSDEAVYTVTPEENLTLIAKFEKEASRISQKIRPIRLRSMEKNRPSKKEKRLRSQPIRKRGL